jgi:hypothetical protein
MGEHFKPIHDDHHILLNPDGLNPPSQIAQK